MIPRRQRCRILALLLFFCLWCAPEASAQGMPSPFEVLSYDSRIDIKASGDILVTEELSIHVPTSGTNRGIIRDIPVNPRWLDLGRQNVRLSVEAVSLNGHPCPTDDTKLTYPVLSVYMRDKTRYLDAGVHHLRLRFRMSEQVGFFEEQDELTWNAVGEFWDGGVKKVRAVVLPPPGTHFTRQIAWLGERGSFDSPVSIRRETIEGREAYVFEAQRPVDEGEAFTVAVAWPKGFVTPASSLRPEDQWGCTLLYALCLLGTLAASYALWARYGRDPQAGAVIPLFYPPKVPERLRAASGKAVTARKGKEQRLLHGEEYMTAVAVHYVHEGGKLEPRGLAALFLSLAQRGDCSLKGNARKNIVVEKLGNSSPAPEESAAAGKLPERFVLNARKSTSNPIGKVYNACKLRLDFDYPMLVTWNLWPQLGLFVLLAIALGVVATVQLGDKLSDLVMEELGKGAAGVLMILSGLLGAGLLIRDAARERMFNFKVLLFILFCLFISSCGYPALEEANLLWIFSPLQWGLMVATLAVPILFCFIMDMPTREQVDLKRQIKGLALYIGTAETERFNTLNPPEEDLQLYHRLLPYAVALGLEDAWGKRFAAKLGSALASDAATMEDTINTTFTHDLIYSSRISLGSYQEAFSAEQAARYASATGGGSSFGGGGGFGGGGAGFDRSPPRRPAPPAGDGHARGRDREHACTRRRLHPHQRAGAQLPHRRAGRRARAAAAPHRQH